MGINPDSEKEKHMQESDPPQGNFLTGGLTCVLPEGRLSAAFTGQTVYCIAFILFICQTFLERMQIGSTILDLSVEKLRLYLRIAALIVLLAKAVLFQRAAVRQWLAAAVIVILGYVTWRTSGSDTMLWLALFIAFGKDVQVKALAECTLLVYVPGLIGTVSLCCAGFLENLTGTRANGMIRYAMGFKHPNTFALFLFMICLSWCVVRFGKKPRSEYVLLAAGALLSYFAANSRTFAALLLLTGVLITVFYYVSSEKLRQAVNILLFAGAIGCVALSFYFMVCYTQSNPLHAWLNDLLSTRLYLSNLYFEEYSLSLFGDTPGSQIVLNVIGTRTSSFMVDNSYANMAIRYGIAATAAFLAGIALFYTDQIRRHTWSACLFGITLFMVLGLTESMTICFQYNYFMIAICGLLYGTAAEPEPSGGRQAVDFTEPDGAITANHSDA